MTTHSPYPVPLQPLLIVAACLWGGCAAREPRWIPDQQRAASFSPYESGLIDNEPTVSFLKKRTAVLVSGNIASVAHVESHELVLYPGCAPDRAVRYGHAVAIERDGYYLTAVHCLDPSANCLVSWDGERLRAMVPRVVARILDPTSHLEVAILHVNVKLPHTFEWVLEREFPPNTPVMALGGSGLSLLSSNRARLSRVPLAGHLCSLRNAGGSSQVVLSDLPTREGDSGGPLATCGGRLIGIHCGVRKTWAGPRRALAARPDRAWIDRVIALDRLQGPHDLPEIPVTTPPPAGSPGLLVSSQ